MPDLTLWQLLLPTDLVWRIRHFGSLDYRIYQAMDRKVKVEIPSHHVHLARWCSLRGVLGASIPFAAVRSSTERLGECAGCADRDRYRGRCTGAVAADRSDRQDADVITREQVQT